MVPTDGPRTDPELVQLARGLDRVLTGWMAEEAIGLVRTWAGAAQRPARLRSVGTGEIVEVDVQRSDLAARAHRLAQQAAVTTCDACDDAIDFDRAVRRGEAVYCPGCIDETGGSG